MRHIARKGLRVLKKILYICWTSRHFAWEAVPKIISSATNSICGTRWRHCMNTLFTWPSPWPYGIVRTRCWTYFRFFGELRWVTLIWCHCSEIIRAWSRSSILRHTHLYHFCWKWYIVGYLSNALWDLWDGSVAMLVSVASGASLIIITVRLSTYFGVQHHQDKLPRQKLMAFSQE